MRLGRAFEPWGRLDAVNSTFGVQKEEQLAPFEAAVESSRSYPKVEKWES